MITERTRRALGVFAIAAVLALVLGWLTVAHSVSAAGTATMTVTPSSTTLAQGSSLTVTLHHNATVTTTGASADFVFDETRLQVVDFQAGPAWAGATVLSGVAPQTKAQSIASANATGTLENLTTYCAPGPGSCSVPAGNAVFFTLQMQVLNNGGTTNLSLAQTGMIDINGDPVPTTSTGAGLIIDGPISVGGFVDAIVAPSESQGGLSVLTIVAAVALGALLLATVGGGLALRKS